MDYILISLIDTHRLVFFLAQSLSSCASAGRFRVDFESGGEEALHTATDSSGSTAGAMLFSGTRVFFRVHEAACPQVKQTCVLVGIRTGAFTYSFCSSSVVISRHLMSLDFTFPLLVLAGAVALPGGCCCHFSYKTRKSGSTSGQSLDTIHAPSLFDD